MYEPWLMRNVVRNRKAAKPNFCIDLEKLDHKVHTLYCELSCLTDGTSALHTADDSFYTPNNVDFSRVNFKTFKLGLTARAWKMQFFTHRIARKLSRLLVPLSIILLARKEYGTFQLARSGEPCHDQESQGGPAWTPRCHI